MAVSILVCNLALGELRAPAIADIAETSTEAIECERYYGQCLSLLLEHYDWSFATRIATLARFGDNGRSAEWAYAYGLPDDLASPKRLMPASVTGSAGGYPWMSDARHAFIVEAGVLYAQMPDAALEYSANHIPETAMPANFRDALAYALAARLAVPLRDDRALKGELLKQSELAAQRAIADDRNRQPVRIAETIDEVTIARGGWTGGRTGGGGVGQ